ncbi:meiosis-specific kinetochore protein isoform X2 [Talpa occidentalis]|uniref:meiosis-specific kinetochore protein isoform X2 n=1 Tax=Talpa occidentalis TaxID=50954 RepID=UPI0023F94EA6|nr:meiosis-specific kinetochore protein isoform X2 [Talpa occidentalis]
MALWPQVYTRKKRACERLNLTPTPDLGTLEKVEAPSGPGRGLPAHWKPGLADLWGGTRDRWVGGHLGLDARDPRGPRAASPGFRLERSRPLSGAKGSGQGHDLAKIVEKAEQSRLRGSGSGPLSTQLRVSGQKSPQENSTSEETQDEIIAPLSESVTDNLQFDSSSSNSELESGLSWQHNASTSLLSYSITDSYTEYKSSEESLSSFPSPELFRGSDHLDLEYPKLEEHMLYKNSTLLDTSKAVVIEKAAQFLNLSTILGTSSEDYQICHRQKVMTFADQNVSPKPKNTSNPESDNATCEILLAEKPYPSTTEKSKKKPEKYPEPSDTDFQTMLSSHLKFKVPSSHQKHVFESNADKSVTKVLLPQPLEPVLKINSSTPDKKSRGLLTSTPSSQTAGLVIDLSPVKNTSFEELFPNISNYVNSNEIVPVSSLQENSSNKFHSNPSEICCIIRASPGTRQVKSKGVVLKKKYSPPKDIPQDIIIKTSGRL